MRKLLLPVITAALIAAASFSSLAGLADADALSSVGVQSSSKGEITDNGDGTFTIDGCLYEPVETKVKTTISDNGEIGFSQEGHSETVNKTERETATASAGISQEYSEKRPGEQRSDIVRETVLTEAGTVGHYRNGDWLWVHDDGSTALVKGGPEGGVDLTYTDDSGQQVGESYDAGKDAGFTQTVGGNTTYHVGGTVDDADNRDMQSRLEVLKTEVEISKKEPGGDTGEGTDPDGNGDDDGGNGGSNVVKTDGHYEYVPSDWVWDKDQVTEYYNIKVGETTFQIEAVANGRVTSELRYTSADGIERTSTGTTECTYEKKIVKKMYLWECSGPESYGSEEYELSSGIYWNTFTQHGGYVITVTPKYYWELWKHTKVTYLKETGAEWVSDTWTEEIDELDEQGVPHTRYVEHDDGYWDPQYSWVTETFDEKVDEGFDLGDPAYHQFDVPLICIGCPPISVCVGCDSSECRNNLNMVCDDNEDGVDVDGISYLSK